MIKYFPLILICHSSIPTNDCIEENHEVTVIRAEPQNSPMSCLMQGETHLAHSEIAPKLDDNMYVKIKCTPKETID